VFACAKDACPKPGPSYLPRTERLEGAPYPLIRNGLPKRSNLSSLIPPRGLTSAVADPLGGPAIGSLLASPSQRFFRRECTTGVKTPNSFRRRTQPLCYGAFCFPFFPHMRFLWMGKPLPRNPFSPTLSFSLSLSKYPASGDYFWSAQPRFGGIPLTGFWTPTGLLRPRFLE